MECFGTMMILANASLARTGGERQGQRETPQPAGRSATSR